MANRDDYLDKAQQVPQQAIALAEKLSRELEQGRRELEQEKAIARQVAEGVIRDNAGK